MYRMLAIILLASLLAAHAAAKERTWTDANGRQMKAEFVREVDGVVTFLKDGMLVTFPLEKLSQSDQQIIRDLAMGKALPEDDAPAPVPVTPSTATETTPPAAAKSDSKPASAAKIAIETRTWTDERGNKTNARFVRINGIDVVLNRAGKILTVSYYTLSEDDQQYVRDVLTQQGKESQIPPERTAATNSDSATAPGGVGSSPVASGFPPGGAPLGGGTGPGRIGGAGPGGIGRGMGPPGMGGGIPRPGGMAGGGMPGMPGGGIPGAGMPGGGIGGGMPGGPGMPGGAGGLRGGGIPTGIPTGIPGSGGAMPGGMPGGIAGSGPSGGGLPGGLPGGAMPGGTMGGMPGGGQPTGIGSGRMGGSGMSAGPGVPDFPSMGSIPAPTMPGSGFSSVPTFKQVYQCSGCKREISESQSSLTKCPYCGTYWVYKDDGSGNKKFNGMAGARSVVGVVVAVIAVIVLGAVGGFIGIIVAIVRAVSRPARRANYR